MQLIFLIAICVIIYNLPKASYDIKSLFNIFIVYYIQFSIPQFRGTGVQIFLEFRVFGLFLLGLLFVKIISSRKWNYFNNALLKYFYLFFFTQIIIFILSKIKYGLFLNDSYYVSLISSLFIIVVSTYPNSSYTIKQFEKTLRALVIFIFILLILTIIGVIDVLYGSDSYLKYRYIGNNHVMMLIVYYIYISQKIINKTFISRIDSILYLLSFGIIITSTQRALTIIFILYLIYEAFVKKGTGIIRFISLTFVTIVLFGLLSQNFRDSLYYAFYDIFYEYETSNAKGKLYDIPAVIYTLYENDKIYFGELINPEQIIFERSFQDFYSSEKRPMHNLYFGQLIYGGLFMFIPYILFWIIVMFRKYKAMSKRNSLSIINTFLFFALLAIFIFNNSSAALFETVLILSFAIIVENPFYSYSESNILYK